MSSDTTEARDQSLEVAVEIGDGWKRRLTITVSPERVTRARSAERNRLAKTLRIKGFRKGRIPPAIVEQRYGDLIDERVRGALVEEAYREAVRDEEIRPAGAASITNIQYAPGERLTFQAEVEIMPSITLGRVGGFRLSRQVAEVEDREVQEILQGIREQQATWKAIERSPGDGDRVSVEIEPLPSAGDPPSGDSKPYLFVLGSGQALADVEKAIKSLEPGGAGTFLVEFPSSQTGEDGESSESSPPDGSRHLHIRLDRVEERELPVLDDQLAARAGSFTSLSELEDSIRQDLARHHEEEAERQLRGQILDALIEANPFSVPETLIGRYLDELLQAPPDADAEEVRKTREALAPHAERQLREQLVLDHLIEREGLQASPAEIQAELAQMASRTKMSPRELRGRLSREGRLEAVGRNLAVQKVFEYLKEQSEIE